MEGEKERRGEEGREDKVGKGRKKKKKTPCPPSPGPGIKCKGHVPARQVFGCWSHPSLCLLVASLNTRQELRLRRSRVLRVLCDLGESVPTSEPAVVFLNHRQKASLSLSVKWNVEETTTSPEPFGVGNQSSRLPYGSI